MSRIQLGEPYQMYIDDVIAEGHFASATEVLRHALRAQMDKRVKLRRQHIHDLIAKGEADIQAGRTVPRTADFMERSMKRAIARHKKGLAIKDEVKPKKA